MRLNIDLKRYTKLTFKTYLDLIKYNPRTLRKERRFQDYDEASKQRQATPGKARMAPKEIDV